jgi:hypothetical protein
MICDVLADGVDNLPILHKIDHRPLISQYCLRIYKFPKHVNETVED